MKNVNNKLSIPICLKHFCFANLEELSNME